VSARSRRRRDLLTLAVFVPLALTILFVYIQSSGEYVIPRGTYSVQAVVPTSVALAENAEVRIAGVRVGKVDRLADRGGDTLLLMKLDDKHEPIYRDARVDVRLRTLVGENYVELDPGAPKAGALPNGGTLKVDRAAEATQVDEVLSTFDRKTRRDLRGFIDGLGGGLENRGSDLNHLLESGSSFTTEASPVFETLRSQRAEVASLVDNLGTVMRALGDREGDLRLLARRSRTALSALAARDDHVARTIRELPSTLQRAAATSTRLAGLSDQATPVLRDLRLSFTELAPVIRDLGPTAARARRTMAALDTFAERGTPLVSSLKRFSDQTVDALPAVREILREYNPFAAYLSRYTRELGAFLASTASVFNGTDATGNLVRINPTITPSMYAGFSAEMAKAYDTLRNIGAVSGVLEQRGNNAYPKPGSIGEPVPFSGEYPRLDRRPP